MRELESNISYLVAKDRIHRKGHSVSCGPCCPLDSRYYSGTQATSIDKLQEEEETTRGITAC